MPLLTNGPSRFLGGRGGIATPIPTYGAELVSNGEFTTNTTGWSASTEGDITRRDFASSPNIAPTGGADNYGAEVWRDTLNNSAYALTNVSVTIDKWYLITCRAYAPSANTGVNAHQLAFSGLNTRGTVEDAWQSLAIVTRFTSGAYIIIWAQSSTLNDKAYYDAVSAKEIALASMFSGAAKADANQDVSAPVTLGLLGTRAGVCARVDSLSAPTSFLIASHDGTNARLTELYGGTYTEHINTAVTYVAGAPIRIWVSGTTAKLYYNGVQVSTNKTVNAGLTGTIFGKFNTFGGNQIGACTIVPAV